MAAHQIERITFSTPRMDEFFTSKGLSTRTGCPPHRFGDVVLKELLDNALDVAEGAEIQPEIIAGVTVDGDTQTVTVSDNGPGMPEDVPERILDFVTVTSSKAAYRSPTRGAQGNALKTIVGIHGNQRMAAPIVIEARGIRHELGTRINQDGDHETYYRQGNSEVTTGTTVRVPLPARLNCDVRAWLQKMAAVNPHARLAQLADCGDVEDAVFYSTVDDGWSKHNEKSPTFPHWYSADAFADLVREYNRAETAGATEDVPLGVFLRTFGGLKSTTKARDVAAQFPDLGQLSDLRGKPDAVAALLKAMQAASNQPKPEKVLGRIPKDHYRQHIDRLYGIVKAPDGKPRFWYQHRAFTIDGVPWIIDVAVAETERPGDGVFGVNYAATFRDPTSGEWVRWEDDLIRGGATALLNEADAGTDANRWGGTGRAVIVHIVCPALQFLDPGKTSLDLPTEANKQLTDALTKATKTLYAEYKRRERNIDAEERRAAKQQAEAQRAENAKKWSVKHAVFAVMDEAARHESSDYTLPFSLRSLYYGVRRLIQQPPYEVSDDRFDMQYFSQTLVPDYEKLHGRIHGLLRKDRGIMREPHTGKEVKLGTWDVGRYQFPEYVYDKILYIEKSGFDAAIAERKLGERYDMAIASSEGYPVEAVRELFARAHAGNYRLYVVHDGDIDGYGIARTMSDEVGRMEGRGYNIDMIDLGLTLDEGIRREALEERFTRVKKLPEWGTDPGSDRAFNELELEWFTGEEIEPDPKTKKPRWRGTRIELNALTQPGVLQMIEDKLKEHGGDDKLVPPQNVIDTTARENVSEHIRGIVDDVIAELIDPDAVADEAESEFAPDDVIRLESSEVRDKLHENRLLTWRQVVDRESVGRLDEDAIRRRVQELLAERIRGAAA